MKKNIFLEFCRSFFFKLLPKYSDFVDSDSQPIRMNLNVKRMDFC